MARSQATFFGIVFLVCALPGESPAQTYPFKHYTTASGLVQATVEKVFQDSKGFLWFGTRAGVSRYDGSSFRSYLSSGSEKSDVKYIWEDDRHTLWFITFGNGIARLKQGDTSIVWMRAADGTLPDDYVNVVCMDRQRQLWIGTMSGLVVVRRDGSSLRFNKRSGLPSDVVHTVKEDQRGYLWLGTNGGVLRCRVTPDGQLEREMVLDTPTRALFVTRDGDMLAATTLAGDGKGRILRFLSGSPKGYTAVTVPETFKCLTIFEDSRGYVWVGGSHGIVVLYKNTVRRITGENGLQNEYVYDIIEDREGTLWVGTENGVAKLPARRLVSYAVSRGSSSDIVLCMFQDSGSNLWFGTYNGLVVVRSDERVERFREADGLRHRLVNAVAEDARGRVWIGTRGGLNIYSGGRFAKASVVGLAEGRSVASIARDKDGSMWLGCIGQIVHVPRSGGTLVIDTAHGLPPDAVRSLVFDHEGTLWFATDEHGAGFYRGKKVTMVTTRDSLPDNRVACVYPDEAGKVWFATHQGVAVWDRGEVHALVEPALPQGPVYFVMKDSARQLWCGTRYGVYALRNGEVQHLSTQDGLAADVVEHGLVDRDGNVWFGTVAGASRLDRVHVDEDVPVPQVYLVQIGAGYNERVVADEARFAFADNTLAFRFNALSFVDETAIHFQWMLEGFDRAYQAPQIQRQVRYTNLSPGNYRFVVRAANRNGPWSLPVTFPFSIGPPFWQTWWFIALVVTALGTILSLAYRYRVNQLLRVERMRSHIAADLHDDIASSLSSVALYSDVIQRELKNAPADVLALLSRIRDLSREVMDSIGLIVWAVDPRRDELTEVVQYFQRYAAQLCSAAGISFVGHLPEDLKSPLLTPDQRRVVFLILKESLNNTLKHSQCSQVVYTCRFVDHMMEMTLQDNGKGFSPDDRTEGHGLQNMSARASAIGAHVTIDSTPGGGTTLRLRMRMA